MLKFYTFLRMGLLYIWVTCDNISALSADYGTKKHNVAVISQLGSIKFIVITALHYLLI